MNVHFNVISDPVNDLQSVCSFVKHCKVRRHQRVRISKSCWFEKWCFRASIQNHPNMANETTFVVRARFQVGCIRCRNDWYYAPTIAIHLLAHKMVVLYSLHIKLMIVWTWPCLCWESNASHKYRFLVDFFLQEFRIYLRSVVGIT